MKSRRKIELSLEKLDLKVSKIEYRNCRSDVVYGDSSPSGSWTVVLENGKIYESDPNYDTVAEAVDIMLEYIRFDCENKNEKRIREDLEYAESTPHKRN